MRAIEIVISVLATGFLLLGWLSRSHLLLQNPCLMTYTTMQKSHVRVQSKLSGVGRLFKHPSGPQLNKYPVLFLHGNLGSADQVRSFSSPMHNSDNFFQYFAIHFNMSLSAAHGGVLVQQATYVNDALRAIRRLYRTKFGQNSEVGEKIMIVGHSYGGFVARLAVLLNNHPLQCPVSDIIMLSTPNLAAPYSPDGSMEKVYQLTNRAWYYSHYNESKSCRSAYQKRDVLLTERESSLEGASVDKFKPGTKKVGEDESLSGVPDVLQMELNCAPCASRIRMLSVSGGDMDMLVPAHLTPLDVVNPRAHNATFQRAKQAEKKVSFLNGIGLSGPSPATTKHEGALGYVYDTLKYLSPVTYIRIVMEGAYAFVKKWREGSGDVAVVADEAASSEDGANSTNSTAATATSTPNATDAAPAASVGGENSHAISGSVKLEKRPEAQDSLQKMQSLEASEWTAHIEPFSESHQHSVRTSMLADVGFPMDHNAILWCRQLVHAVSACMRELASDPELQPHRLDPIFRHAYGLGDWDVDTAFAEEAAPQLFGEDALQKALKKNAHSSAAGAYFRTLLPMVSGPNQSTAYGNLHFEGAENAFLHSDRALIEGRNGSMLPPVATFHYRNASSHAFKHLASATDASWMYRTLTQADKAWSVSKQVPGFAALQVMAVTFIGRHLSAILAFYVMLGLSAVLVPLRRRYTNFYLKQGEMGNDAWNTLSLYTTLHLEDFMPLLVSGVGPIARYVLPPALLRPVLALGKRSKVQKGMSVLKQWAPGVTQSAEAGAGARLSGDRLLSACGVVLAVLVKVGLDLVTHRGNLYRMLASYAWLGAPLLCLFTSLSMRAFCLVLMYGTRVLARGGWRAWCLACNFTIWRPQSPHRVWYRAFYRGLLKRYFPSLPSHRERHVKALSYALPVLSAGVVALQAGATYGVRRAALGTGRWLLSLLTCGASLHATLQVGKALFYPCSHSPSKYNMQTQFALLYLPVLLLLLPSVLYSCVQLYSKIDSFVYMMPVLDLFNNDRINAFLAIFTIGWHLSYIDGDLHAGKMKKVDPLPWLCAILDRPAALPADPGAAEEGEEEEEEEEEGGGLTWESGTRSGGGDLTGMEGWTYIWHKDRVTGARLAQGFYRHKKTRACIHEDGGAKAIMQSTAHVLYEAARANQAGKGGKGPQEVTTVGPGVELGPTFHVVSCQCARDKRLQDHRDWCSFCLCSRCGDKDGLAAHSARGEGPVSGGAYTGSASPTRPLKKIEYDVSANLVLIVALACMAFCTILYVKETPSRLLYLLGAAGFGFMAADFAVWARILAR